METRTGEALDALEALVDGGWWTDWQWHLEANPIFDPIRDRPRYRRLIDRLERDTLRQQQALAGRE